MSTLHSVEVVMKPFLNFSIIYNMNNSKLNQDQPWFVYYDAMTLDSKFINDGKMQDIINNFERMTPSSLANQYLNPWNKLLANGLAEIYSTLANFFNVQQKLSQNEDAKNFFKKLVQLLNIEIKYKKFFFVRSEHFSYHRILSSGIRLSKYLQFLYFKIQSLKSKFDLTFFENIKEVYLYTEQKIKQILLEQWDGKYPVELDRNKLIRVMLHLLNLLIQFNGGVAKQVFLNELIQNQYVQQIGKSNSVYFEFTKYTKVDEIYSVEMDTEHQLKYQEDSHEDQYDN